MIGLVSLFGKIWVEGWDKVSLASTRRFHIVLLCGKCLATFIRSMWAGILCALTSCYCFGRDVLYVMHRREYVVF